MSSPRAPSGDTNPLLANSSVHSNSRSSNSNSSGNSNGNGNSAIVMVVVIVACHILQVCGVWGPSAKMQGLGCPKSFELRYFDREILAHITPGRQKDPLHINMGNPIPPKSIKDSEICILQIGALRCQ